MSDPLQRVSFLIVGAGVAGAAAAEGAAKAGGGGVVLVGREVQRPYHRPPLSKAWLRGEIGKADLVAQPSGYFEEHGIRLVTGRWVTQIDASRHRATLDDGHIIQFEQCCLAHGATPAPLEVTGGGLPGLFYLRSLADAEQLKLRVKLAKEAGGGRCVVFGGGLLGVEVAASLRRLGLHVHLVLEHSRPWAKVAGEAAGQFITNLLDEHGIELHPQNPPAALLGDGRLQRVKLTDATELACDFAVACVGWSVDPRPVANTGVTVGRAIHTDEFGRTGVDRLWAAGDCCAMNDLRFGKLLTCGHWDVARLQGELVGRNMAATLTGGELSPWTEVPGWHSEVFGHDIFSWGTPRLTKRSVVRGGGSAFAEFGIDAEERVCHVVTSGRESEDAALRQLVADRAPASAV